MDAEQTTELGRTPSFRSALSHSSSLENVHLFGGSFKRHRTADDVMATSGGQATVSRENVTEKKVVRYASVPAASALTRNGDDADPTTTTNQRTIAGDRRRRPVHDEAREKRHRKIVITIVVVTSVLVILSLLLMVITSHMTPTVTPPTISAIGGIVADTNRPNTSST